MKSIFKHISKKLIAVATAVTLVTMLSASAIASFGPNRPTKAWSPTVDGFDHVTFNSFTNVPNGVGDERDFLRGVQVGRDSVWSDPVTGVTQGAEVEAKIYIHNNADSSLNDQPGNPGVAKNVTVKATVPSGSKQTQQVDSSIFASNASPDTVTDTLDITGANNGFFELAYVPGSAKLHRGSAVTALSDSLVTTGVNIGDQKGCFEYIQEVTFRMKVNMPRYTIEKVVGVPGQPASSGKENLDVNQGDTASWLVTFKNIGQTELKSVKIVDEVPAGLTVVPGSIKLTNGNYPNGYVISDSAIQAKGRQINVDIGNYGPGILAYISYRTTVDKVTTNERCSTRSLVNKVYSTPQGYGAIWDTAQVTVKAEVCAGTPSYACDLLKVTQGENRTVTIDDFKASSANGATFKHVVIDWDDKTTPLTADANTVKGKTHTYAADGTYTIKATAVFTVDGKDVSAVSDACAKSVTFSSTPTELPNTGSGDILGVFAAVTVAGALAHRLILSRRFL